MAEHNNLVQSVSRLKLVTKSLPLTSKLIGIPVAVICAETRLSFT
jgi:hypothetical protein